VTTPLGRRAAGGGARRPAVAACLGLALLAVTACGAPAEPGPGRADAEPAPPASASPSAPAPTTPSPAFPTAEPGAAPGVVAAPIPTPEGTSAPQAEVSGAQAVPGPAGEAPAVPEGRRPVAVRVPAIGVDAPLVDLAVGGDGAIEVPTAAGDAGWLTTSSLPGERGPAVVAGHVALGGVPAVFADLDELGPGDDVVLVLEDGTEVPFSVDAVESFPKDSFPTDRVYGPTPAPVLRLITCGGDVDPRTGHYVDNVVAYAS